MVEESPACGPEDCTPPPVAGDELLTQIGRNFVESGHYHQCTADRTGELMRVAVETTERFRRAQIVGVEETDTGTKAFAILSPDGGVKPLPKSIFDEYRDAPKRRSGNAEMTRIGSFIEHVNRFKTGSSALFARDDMTTPRLTAVLDYHHAVTDLGDLGPDFCDHTAGFAFPLSEEWKAWVKLNGKAMDNIEFAEFLEERFIDIEHVTDPSVLNEDIRKALGNIGVGGLGTPNSVFA